MNSSPPLHSPLPEQDGAPPAVVISNGKIPALDGFRAIAVVIVMLSHVGLGHMAPGTFGVTLFFFLSGFLITTLLRQEFEARGRIDFGRFYLRRVVRIFPPMYLSIALVALLAATGLHPALHYPGITWDLLFLTNYIQTSGVTIPLWSLAVEEHFYLMFPVMLGLLAPRLPMKAVAGVCLGLCALVLLIRLVQAPLLDDMSQIKFWTHTRINSILFGCILALWNNPVVDPGNRLWDPLRSYAIAGIILLATFVIRDEWFRQTLRYSLQGIGLLILFNAAIRDNVHAPRLLDNPLASYIALLSYSLYLVHYPLILTVKSIFPQAHPVVSYSMAMALSFIVADVMCKWVERPLAAWRRSVERKRISARAVQISDA